jgi:tetratricopeptide (TPR) repeat protein
MPVMLRKQPVAASDLQRFWEKYGTWMSAGVAVVLALLLVMTLYRRHAESRLAEGRVRLDMIGHDKDDAVRLEALAQEYRGTALEPGIELKLGRVLYRSGDSEAAERRFNNVLESETAHDLDRAQAHLGLAYAAQARGDLAEARKRYEKVREDRLYASEAERMLALLDKMEPKEAPEKTP